MNIHDAVLLLESSSHVVLFIGKILYEVHEAYNDDSDSGDNGENDDVTRNEGHNLHHGEANDDDRIASIKKQLEFFGYNYLDVKNPNNGDDVDEDDDGDNVRTDVKEDRFSDVDCNEIKNKTRLKNLLKVLNDIYTGNLLECITRENKHNECSNNIIDKDTMSDWKNTSVYDVVKNQNTSFVKNNKDSAKTKNDEPVVSLSTNIHIDKLFKNSKCLSHKKRLLPEYTEGMSEFALKFMQVGSCVLLERQNNERYNTQHHNTVVVVMDEKARTLYWFPSPWKQMEGKVMKGGLNKLKSNIPMTLLAMKRSNSQLFINETTLEGFLNVDLITDISLRRLPTSQFYLTPTLHCKQLQHMHVVRNLLSIQFSNNVADNKCVHFQITETSSIIWHLGLLQVWYTQDILECFNKIYKKNLSLIKH